MSRGDMPRTRRDLIRQGIVAGGVLSIAGCTSDDPAGDDSAGDDAAGDGAADQETGNKLVFSSGSSVEQLHPQYRMTNADSQMLIHVTEPLFIFGDNIQAKKRLAEEYSLSDDGSRVTVKIREGVKFHPPVDRELVADDVVASLNNVRNDEAAVGNLDMRFVEQINRVDDYTVEVNMSRAFPAIINDLFCRQYTAILPAERVGDGNDKTKELPIGTGPFKFEEWERGSFVQLSKFEDYWQDDLEYVDEVEFNPISEDSTRVNTLATGDTDVVPDVPGNRIGQVQESDDTSIAKLEGKTMEYVGFNCNREPFTDSRVRRAVRHAIDIERLIQTAVDGRGTPASTIIPDSNPMAFDKDPIQQDMEMARSLLQETGLDDGFEFTMKVPEAFSASVRMATPMKQMLQKVNINMKIQRLTWDTFADQCLTGNNPQYDMQAIAWLSTPATAYGGLNKVLNSESVLNYWNYESSEMDELLNAAAVEPDSEQRKEAYAEVQELRRKDMPMFNAFYHTDIFGHKDHVNGKLIHGYGEVRLWNNNI